MTSLTKPVRRQTIATYKHHQRKIVITLFADTLSLRLKGTRTSFEMPIAHLLDDLCRREAQRIAAERKKRKKSRR
jgi:predicted amidophosphoribosyltransferase